jgi:O-antigen biosynthesis protein
MKLSVIIVNYNVKYFLEQCLHSVLKAVHNIPCEIFVVDNNSVDGSVGMVEEKFKTVKIIANKKNTGFSYANNQAIKQARGEYILLLNPDTVVEENTFEEVVKFMDSHPDGGGLGVKMLDGKGNFLPESKRGLPTPAVAFYKIFGLSRLFPKSKIFGKYHLGYLNKEQNHEIEILSGAFMLLRKSVLDKIGLLDEAFFMYGEDIDLSYRIIKAGYKNYYFSETRIIHYKGESTKKSSINYVFVFYRAMVIFAEKHFSKKNAKAFSFLINIAIYFRALVAILARFAKQLFLPAVDAILVFCGTYLITNYWEQHVKFLDGSQYPSEFIGIAVPIYIFIWLLTIYFFAGYDKPIKLIKIAKGIGIGTGIILIIYALLPENYRFSRALILMGATWALVSIVGLRLLLHLLGFKGYVINSSNKKRFAIVGDEEESMRVSNLLSQTSLIPSFVGLVYPEQSVSNKNPNYIGSMEQVKEIIEIYKIDELIFCAKNLSAQKIIDYMAALGNSNVDFKIAPPESLYLIGSNSIDTSGDLYVIDINSITKISNRRNKRLLDFTSSLLFISLSPLLLLFMHKPFQFIWNCLRVLVGNRTWVGYKLLPGEEKLNPTLKTLPLIKKGIISAFEVQTSFHADAENIKRINLLYSKDYTIWNDLSIIIKGFRRLGNV